VEQVVGQVVEEAVIRPPAAAERRPVKLTLVKATQVRVKARLGRVKARRVRVKERQVQAKARRVRVKGLPDRAKAPRVRVKARQARGPRAKALLAKGPPVRTLRVRARLARGLRAKVRPVKITPVRQRQVRALPAHPTPALPAATMATAGTPARVPAEALEQATAVQLAEREQLAAVQAAVQRAGENSRRHDTPPFAGAYPFLPSGAPFVADTIGRNNAVTVEGDGWQMLRNVTPCYVWREPFRFLDHRASG
jgi:hypothetical protein